MPSVPIIICLWNRPERLSITLKLLGQQTDKDFKLYLWNNNPKIIYEVDKVIEDRQRNFPVQVRHSPDNVGGFGRFYLARELSSNNPHVIFLDDDEEFSKGMVKTFKRETRPRTISGFWAFKLHNPDDYWDRGYHDRSLLKPGETATYCGTGGIVTDSSIFKDQRLYDCPLEYRFFEDLWLSYFALHIMNWKIYKSDVHIKIIDDGKDQGLGKEETKSEFLRYLVHSGWKF